MKTKKKAKAAMEVKFEQIAVASNKSNPEGYEESLFGLDAKGAVWVYSWEETVWHRLSMNGEIDK